MKDLSHIPDPEAERAWFFLRAQAVLLAVVGLLPGLLLIVLQTALRSMGQILIGAQVALLLLWLVIAVVLRFKSARLRTEYKPHVGRAPLALAAFPCLLLAGLLLPEVPRFFVALLSFGLFAVLLLSVVGFAIGDIPVRTGWWALAVLLSLAVALTLNFSFPGLRLDHD